MEAPQQPSSPASVAEQPEVVPEHHDRVEYTQSGADSCDGADASIANAAKYARLDRERRAVDCYDLVTARLQMQRDTPSPAAHIKHSAADQWNGLPFDRGPLVEWGEISRRAGRKIEPMIVTFDNLGGRKAIVVCVNQLAVCVSI
jgi:hypothetical protein